jgi:glutamate synthase domain-containing protein 2
MATPIDVVVAMSLGADAVYIARGFLLALGCIQALDCHSNHCPTGIATQDAKRQRALDVEGASERVSMYAQALQHEVMILTKSCGYTSPSQFTADDVMVVTRPGHLDYLSELQGVSAWEAAQERKMANAEGMTVGEWKRTNA